MSQLLPSVFSLSKRVAFYYYAPIYTNLRSSVQLHMAVLHFCWRIILHTRLQISIRTEEIRSQRNGCNACGKNLLTHNHKIAIIMVKDIIGISYTELAILATLRENDSHKAASIHTRFSNVQGTNALRFKFTT
jgi:hypothetical protein